MIINFKLYEKYGNLDNIEKKFANLTCIQLGYQLGDCLGSGHFGSTFEIKDDDGNIKTLKITSDIGEAKMANKLRKKPYTQHIINYYDVRLIASEVSLGVPHYAIIMDKIKPLSTEESHMIEKCFDNLPTWISSLIRRKNDKERLKMMDEIDFPQENEKFYKNFFLQMIELSKEMKHYGIKGTDLHTGNLGWNGNNLVFYDIGLEEVKQTKVLKPINAW